MKYNFQADPIFVSYSHSIFLSLSLYISASLCLCLCLHPYASISATEAVSRTFNTLTQEEMDDATVHKHAALQSR